MYGDLDCFDLKGNLEIRTCTNGAGGCHVDRISYYFNNGSELHTIDRGCVQNAPRSYDVNR